MVGVKAAIPSQFVSRMEDLMYDFKWGSERPKEYKQQVHWALNHPLNHDHGRQECVLLDVTNDEEETLRSITGSYQ
ncbi:hypothetical protein PFICI_14019 [Pestalotiopsis fici W106-1]|uniref:Uncharacterized protein n=1 Tax=Pestalotiopsis fici (strain W106-1 / CGMCC3.15140) TaxID=1229662 RepID=W3WJW0_PESFW|nr:uncharacterized protein PFICI_14019 [Pestalotiopsis fici W106-1]ETS74153.1 hypothetical protein PFICI_14019 [Pestalotiopsis fici W106-1]